MIEPMVSDPIAKATHPAAVAAHGPALEPLEPSFSFRITGDDWRFEGPSGVLGDPEHPDYLFFERVPEAEIAFFNLRKLKGVYDPRGPAGEIEPMPAPDELVGWFQHHPYLKTSKPEPISVGGVKGVQFNVDVVLWIICHFVSA